MAQFKEFERRFKLYQMFQDLSRFLADLNGGSNSLNSISDQIIHASRSTYSWFQIKKFTVPEQIIQSSRIKHS